ncbi:MAG: stage V sporulation protein AE [Bacillota bacterium]
MTLVWAFVVGGTLCAIAQVFLDSTKANPALVMVSSVSVGAILSGLGLYGPLIKLGGAGATIPLLGFGHTLVTGMVEDAQRVGLFGILTGGFRAASSALMAAIVFGHIMAVLFNPKG